MTTDIIQANYEHLDSIAHRFTQQAEIIQEMQTRLRGALEPLQSGGWVGRGSEAFAAEMNAETLPAVERLHTTLAEAGQATLEIIRTLQQAEEEAARPFQGAFDGLPTGGAPGQAAGESTGTGSTEQNAAPASSQHLVVRDPQTIFNEGYMESFIGSRFEGQNSAELNQLMEDLFRAGRSRSPEVDRLLDRIADIRGVDRAEFRAQYQTYLQLLDNGRAIGGNDPDIDLKQHGDFLGSTVSLRYGAVVGEVFGLDPVFGSLLNPTGGLVGPGSTAYWPDDNDAIGYHGIFHDAAGYLYNYQGVGPGYNYLGREDRPTDSPLTGQISGISWWMAHPQLDAHVPADRMPNIPILTRSQEYDLGRGADSLIPVVRVLSAANEGGTDIVDGIGDVFDGNFKEGVGDIGEGLGTIVVGVGRSVIDIFD